MTAVEGFTHAVRIAPRYGETDRMGVVYYGRYFDWFEVARTECFKALGMPYRDLEARGILLPVLEATARYHAPARYDVEVEVTATVERFRRGMVRFAYAVREAGLLLAEGSTRHLFVRGGKRLALSAADLAALFPNAAGATDPDPGDEGTDR